MGAGREGRLAQMRCVLRECGWRAHGCSAGKYVPSLSHYILQVDSLARGYYEQLRVSPCTHTAAAMQYSGMLCAYPLPTVS